MCVYHYNEGGHLYKHVYHFPPLAWWHSIKESFSSQHFHFMKRTLHLVLQQIENHFCNNQRYFLSVFLFKEFLNVEMQAFLYKSVILSCPLLSCFCVFIRKHCCALLFISVTSLWIHWLFLSKSWEVIKSAMDLESLIVNFILKIRGFSQLVPTVQFDCSIKW